MENKTLKTQVICFNVNGINFTVELDISEVQKQVPFKLRINGETEFKFYSFEHTTTITDANS